MLQRSGRSCKSHDNRGAVSLKGRLRVWVIGKKSLKGGLDSKIVNLISDRETLDGNCLICPKLLKNDKGPRVPVGEGI